MNMFSVRFVKADHYMNTPIPGLDVRYSEFRASEVKQVPVIRIFGSSTSGQKVCLHIHGVFPYFYIPYDETIEKDRFRYQIASALDKAINISLGNSSSHTQHVYKISVVSGLPLYGYHSKAHQFLKIFLYNPLLVKKATDLLLNGVILGQAFQPHEAHVPFILQFCIDYNIHGMSLVHLSTVRYRRVPEGGLQNHASLLDNVPDDLLLPDSIARISTCSLEVDGIAADVLNHKEISGNLSRNPGLKAIWDEEYERRKAEMRSSQITPVNTQNRQAAASTSSEAFYLERLKKRLLQIASVKTPGPSLEPRLSGDKPYPYPAETPEGENMLEASFLETHVSSLSDQTQNSGHQLRGDVQKSDDALLDREAILSLTSGEQNMEPSPDSLLNSQCLSLVRVLQELVEEDSVLGSQLQKDESPDSDVESNEGDPTLSQTLGIEHTDCQHPTFVHGTGPVDAVSKEDFYIPQLDGANDVLGEEEVHDSQKPGPSGINNHNQQMSNKTTFPTLVDEDELDEISLAFKESVDCETSLPLEFDEGTDGESGQKEIYTGNFSAFRLDDSCNPAISIPAGPDTSSNTEYNFGRMKPGEPLENYLIADPWMTVAPGLSEKDELLETVSVLSGEDLWVNEGETSLWPSDLVQTNLPTVAELACSLEPSVLSELSPIKAVPSLDCSTNSDSSSETKRKLSSLIKSRTKAKEGHYFKCDLQDVVSDVEENESVNPVQFPSNFVELVDVDNMQALLSEIGEGDFLTDELMDEAKYPCSSVDNSEWKMETLEPVMSGDYHPRDSGLFVEQDSVKADTCRRKKSTRASKALNIGKHLERKVLEAGEVEGKPNVAERKRRGRRPKNSKEVNTAEINPSRLSSEEKISTDNGSEDFLGRVKPNVDHCYTETITSESGIHHQNAHAVRFSSNQTVKEKLGMHIRNSLRCNRNANVHQSTHSVCTSSKPDAGTVQNKASHILGNGTAANDTASVMVDMEHTAVSSPVKVIESSELTDLLSSVMQNPFTSSSSVNSEVSSSTDKLTAVTEQLGNNEREIKKEIGLYVRQKLGMLVGSRSKLRAEAASCAVSGAAKDPTYTSLPSSIGSVGEKLKEECLCPKSKLQSAVTGSSKDCDYFQRVPFSRKQEHDFSVPLTSAHQDTSISDNLLNCESTIEAESEGELQNRFQSSKSVLKLHCIYPCYVKLKRCNQIGSSKQVDGCPTSETESCITELSLIEKSNDNSVEILLNPSKDILCGALQNETVNSLRGMPDLSGPMNFDTNHGATEFITNCVIPKSSNTCCKSVKKANREIGSLKAVVQAESPRVADTLDSLPENPLHSIRHYAPGVGTILGVTDVESIPSEIKDTSSEIHQLPRVLLCDDISKSDYNQNKTLCLLDNKDEFNFFQENKGLPDDVNSAEHLEEGMFEHLLSFTRVQDSGRQWPTEVIGDRFGRKKRKLSETAESAKEICLIDNENQNASDGDIICVDVASACGNVGTEEGCVDEAKIGQEVVEETEFHIHPEQQGENYKSECIVEETIPTMTHNDDKNINNEEVLGLGQVLRCENVGKQTPAIGEKPQSTIPVHLRGFPRIRLKPQKSPKRKRIHLKQRPLKIEKQKKVKLGRKIKELSTFTRTSDVNKYEGENEKKIEKQKKRIKKQRESYLTNEMEENSETSVVNMAIDGTAPVNTFTEAEESPEKDQEVQFPISSVSRTRTSKNDTVVCLTGDRNEKCQSIIINDTCSRSPDHLLKPKIYLENEIDIQVSPRKIRAVKNTKRDLPDGRNVNRARSSAIVDVNGSVAHSTSNSLLKCEENTNKGTKVVDSKTRARKRNRQLNSTCNKELNKLLMDKDVNDTAAINGSHQSFQGVSNSDQETDQQSKFLVSSINKQRTLKTHKELDLSSNRNVSSSRSFFKRKEDFDTAEMNSYSEPSLFKPKESFRKKIEKHGSSVLDEKTKTKRLSKIMGTGSSVKVDSESMADIFLDPLRNDPDPDKRCVDARRRNQLSNQKESILESLREKAPIGDQRNSGSTVSVNTDMDKSDIPATSGNSGISNKGKKSKEVTSVVSSVKDDNQTMKKWQKSIHPGERKSRKSVSASDMSGIADVKMCLESTRRTKCVKSCKEEEFSCMQEEQKNTVKKQRGMNHVVKQCKNKSRSCNMGTVSTTDVNMSVQQFETKFHVKELLPSISEKTSSHEKQKKLNKGKEKVLKVAVDDVSSVSGDAPNTLGKSVKRVKKEALSIKDCKSKNRTLTKKSNQSKSSSLRMEVIGSSNVNIPPHTLCSHGKLEGGIKENPELQVLSATDGQTRTIEVDRLASAEKRKVNRFLPIENCSATSDDNVPPEICVNKCEKSIEKSEVVPPAVITTLRKLRNVRSRSSSVTAANNSTSDVLPAEQASEKERKRQQQLLLCHMPKTVKQDAKLNLTNKRKIKRSRSLSFSVEANDKSEPSTRLAVDKEKSFMKGSDKKFLSTLHKKSQSERKINLKTENLTNMSLNLEPNVNFNVDASDSIEGKSSQHSSERNLKFFSETKVVLKPVKVVLKKLDPVILSKFHTAKSLERSTKEGQRTVSVEGVGRVNGNEIPCSSTDSGDSSDSSLLPLSLLTPRSIKQKGNSSQYSKSHPLITRTLKLKAPKFLKRKFNKNEKSGKEYVRSCDDTMENEELPLKKLLGSAGSSESVLKGLECESVPSRNKRLLLPRDMQRKARNKLKRIPCVDGAMDSTDSDSSEEDNGSTLKKKRLEAKHLGMMIETDSDDELFPASQSSSDSDLVPDNLVMSPKKCRYRPLEVLIKKSPPKKKSEKGSIIEYVPKLFSCSEDLVEMSSGRKGDVECDSAFSKYLDAEKQKHGENIDCEMLLPVVLLERLSPSVVIGSHYDRSEPLEKDSCEDTSLLCKKDLSVKVKIPDVGGSTTPDSDISAPQINLLSLGRELPSKAEELEGSHSAAVPKEEASVSMQPRGDASHFAYQKSLALLCEDSLPNDKKETSDLKCSQSNGFTEPFQKHFEDSISKHSVPDKKFQRFQLLKEKSDNEIGKASSIKEKKGWRVSREKFREMLAVTEPPLTVSTICTSCDHVITLKKGPPTAEQVMQSLHSLKLPLHQNVHPYFSSALDAAERKEVGSRSLRVPSCSVLELDAFESTLLDIMSLFKQRDETVNCLLGQTQCEGNGLLQLRDMKAALASQRDIVLIPCRRAPSVSDVKRWAKARITCKEFQMKQESKEKFEKLLFTIPASPGSDISGEETCLSLTPLSQNSLKDYTKDQNNLDIEKTPSSTPDDGSKSPSVKIKRSDEASSTRETPNITFSRESQKPGEAKTSGESSASWQNLVAQTQFRQQFDTPRAGNRSVRSNESIDFKMSYENLQDARAVVEHQYLTVFVLELHVQTRADLCPDPAYDPVCAAFFTIQNDVPGDSSVPQTFTGMIVVQNSASNEDHNPIIHGVEPHCECQYVPDEKALFQQVVNLAQRWDPDILAGYEVEMHSWGYLFQRAFTLEMNLCPMISRVPSARQGNTDCKTPDETVVESGEEIPLVGRIMLNGWRLMRHEVALQSYTFENIAFHVLHERIPLVPSKVLTQWWGHRTRLHWGRVADHYLIRVRGLLRIFDQLDLINRTAELARIFGIQFYEVLSRGSQFRVESMMLRLAKPSNYIAVSPSVQQRAKMRAPECLQLIMEPESRLYVDPVIVLDFQSLYPSMIIAYNYCYSTCLGRVEHLGQATPFEFGCSRLRVSPDEVKRLMNNLNISPCGAAFVNASIRKGILPRMLEEILETRLMVKKSMKEHKDQKTLLRVLHSRQLGLKLIANVTYGYTAANFSGRMACVEVGDSVVSKGRETLERAIHLVENTPRWGARVVYGDTDSLFVLVPGRSRQDAFAIGAQIAEAVTQDNPRPVKLKLEKVYQPCLLQTKKRYVGYMYESPEQKDPVYDAKGIETVRRDGCPAVAKVLERSIRLLFETKDVSRVKSYVQRQFSKLLDGTTSLQDLIFAREFRGMAGYKPGACVPALELAKKWLQTDPRAEPRVGERVPYIVASGPPNVPLIQLVRSPHELLADPGLKVHAHYYVSRVLCPPLDRCFSLIGVDVHAWYTDLPRKVTVSLPVCALTTSAADHKRSTISQYFSTVSCAACSQVCQTGLCFNCQAKPQLTAVILLEKIRQWERNYCNLEKICQSCSGNMNKIECISLDCPVLYRRHQAWKCLQQESFVRSLLDQLQ